VTTSPPALPHPATRLRPRPPHPHPRPQRLHPPPSRTGSRLMTTPNPCGVPKVTHCL
jgi:hypothetical protein